MHVLGRQSGDGPVGHLGRYRARDGSAGAPVGLDLDRPHVVLIVGKRGYGKSHTMGVIAEELAAVPGTTTVVGDTMGAFASLAAEVDAARSVDPGVRAGAIAPRTWCELLGVEPEGPTGSLCWRAAAPSRTLDDMLAFVTDAAADRATRRAARNHLRLAADWGVFGADRHPVDGAACTRIDLAGCSRPATNAVIAAAADRAYRRCVERERPPLPWLLLDEAHVPFQGAAERSLRRVVTRGRQPGVSLVAATQRPSALPAVAVSQADVLIAHRLTSRADREALAAVRPAYVSTGIDERLPTAVGDALVVDDATETAHTITIRERTTPHDGASPRARHRADTETDE